MLLFLAACTERNPSYCNSNTECGSGSCDVASHTCLGGAGGAGGTGGADGGAQCSGDNQCSTPTPRCVSGSCVQCVGPSDCTGGHICDTGTQMCRACTDDATCDISGYPGGACLAGGCVPANMIAFASCWFAMCPGDGKRDTPYCNAQDAIDSGKPLVVLQPGFCVYRSLRVSDKTLQLWGRNMGLFPSDQADGLTITGGNANVDVHDLIVTGLANNMLTNGHSGVFVTSGATARLSRVQVHDLPNTLYAGVRVDGAAAITIDSGLVYRNQGWGIYMHQTPSFTITNSFLLGNGTANSITGGTGGVRFDNGSGGQTNLFAFNTVAQNLSSVGLPAGVQCDTAVTLTDALLPDNAISAMCTADHSVLPKVPARDLAQIFVNVSAPQDSLTRCSGFHVNPNGRQADAVIGKGTPVASITVDVDGDPRATPPTVGADEPLPCQ